jgi:rfaE bifunctional protein kinase chain/domain/rfaE bifunctional protein nucleotidyltransferase chain/domain
MGKIKTLVHLAKTAEKLKKEGKKIVLCHGVFDLIHPGHIRHLQSAKRLGDILLVTITADQYVKKGPGRPIFRQELRAEVLAAIRDVDFVSVIPSESAIEAIKRIRPDFYVKGPDYKTRRIHTNVPRKLTSEEEAVQSVGGKLIFTQDDVIFSSSKLINDYLDVYPPATRTFLENFKKKYGIDYVIDALSTLSKMKVLIIGDAIIDQYHYCIPLGKSSKEPIMVHRYVSEESFAGGAIATANHVSSLVKDVTLLTVLGKRRSYEQFIRRRLKSGVRAKFFYRPREETIVKRRFLDYYSRQKLFQVTIINDNDIPVVTENQIVRALRADLDNYDLVIVNDFGHGMLTKRLVKLLVSKAKYLALNVQANSANYGYNIVTKYPHADFVCIDEQEIRLATHDKNSPLEKLLKIVFRRMKCSFMIVTRGANGSLSYDTESGLVTTPSLTRKVVDRVGAGDALFAVSSPCVYAKLPHSVVTFLGNIAGALQVQEIGNKKPVEMVDITKFVNRLLK